jgi:hypothetical protein
VSARIIWIDQAEYYFVCDECYAKERHTMWSGSTTVHNWVQHRHDAEEEAKIITHCESCHRKLISPKGGSP